MAQETQSEHIGFRTLHTERTDEDLPVEGSIPDWLEGTLLRTGPAQFEVGDRRLNHWFDGLAMVHRFAVDGEAVTYTNRYLETNAFEHARREDELGVGEFATDPCRRIWEKFFTLFSAEPTDNANVNVTRLADRFLSMTETPMPVEFDPETLETLGTHEEWADIGHLTTAHPHHDRGETVTYLTRFGRTSEYRVVRMPEGTTDREIVATVERDRPAYMHSFGLTERYVVLVEFPLVVRPLDVLVRDRPFIEHYRWSPERGTTVLLVDRNGGRVVRELETEPFFSFHHVNAFEDDDSVVVDLVTFEDASIIDALYLDRIESEEFTPHGGRLDRLRVGPETIEREEIVPGPIELPRINYGRVNTRPYRYAYGVGNRESPPRDVPNTLVKVDVHRRETQVWEEPETYAGEPVFVPTPDGTAEDDGVVLSVVLDAATERSFLLVLDAADFEELARASVPHHVPLGFHGNFFA